MQDPYTYRVASRSGLERIWQKNLAKSRIPEQCARWREEYIANNLEGKCVTFLVEKDGEPVGEGTLLFSPACSAINGRLSLADGGRIANINALRIEKAYENQGHISRLVKEMERYAAKRGCTTLTIGVEARETRNLAIYLHWGYCRFVMSGVEDGALVLYYAKNL